MLLAQISDCHIGAPGFTGLDDLDPIANLTRCIDQIMAAPVLPDAVLLTGDLVHRGQPDDYRALRACLAALPMAQYVIPGNHDDRAALRHAFADHHYLDSGEGPIRYVLDFGGLRLLCLDSVIEGEDGGRLGAAQLAWLEARLAESPDRDNVIVMHHPPFDIGIHRMDRIKCLDGPALARVLEKGPPVSHILCGHGHHFATTRFAGAVAIAAPSTAAQFTLDLTPGAKAGWSATEPPAYLLHHWHPGAGLTTHLCALMS